MLILQRSLLAYAVRMCISFLPSFHPSSVQLIYPAGLLHMTVSTYVRWHCTNVARLAVHSHAVFMPALFIKPCRCTIMSLWWTVPTLMGAPISRNGGPLAAMHTHTITHCHHSIIAMGSYAYIVQAGQHISRCL